MRPPFAGSTAVLLSSPQLIYLFFKPEFSFFEAGDLKRV